MYKNCRGKTPVCERIWQRLLTLPLYPDLTDDDFGLIVAAIHEFGRTEGL
jgi:dTDP-4-amino-4,6-dideoxygalactose transaminase